MKYPLDKSLKKISRLYREGGISLIIERLMSLLIFEPEVPPIGIIVKSKLIEIGYRSKYIYNGTENNLIPRPNDTVVEAGVHLGVDTATFSKFSKRVIGFEPSPRNYHEAKDKLRKFENVRIYNKGLWNEKDELEIIYGESRGDDGFLKPDSNSVNKPNIIPVNTLDKYKEELDIESIDFLKVEAEGAEPEIIAGLGNLRPRIIVVNCGEERKEKSTGIEVIKMLKNIGYSLVCIKRGHILFFTFEDIEYSAFRSGFT